MELLVAGLYIIFSAFLSSQAEKKGAEFDGLVFEKNEIKHQYKLAIWFGVLLLLMGWIGIALGAYSFEVKTKELTIYLCFLCWINIQLRLVVFNEKFGDVDKATGSSLFKLLSHAASLGFFLRGGGVYVWLVGLTQFLILFLVICLVVLIFY